MSAFVGTTLPAAASSSDIHPRLLLSPAEVATIRSNLGRAPLFDAALAEARERVETALAAPIDVPVPRDAAGYTHERHKQNYAEMQLAGILYQLTRDTRYATFVREHLERYAQLYPTLKDHPASRSSSPGRLFHQSLNETVWLVHVSEAYDCIFETLSAADRARYEEGIFRPMCRFLSEERVHEFDRIHNHGTWTATAVGMTGYVMGDQTQVQKALGGSKRDGTGGYFRQLDELFSPDGYYCEGPYYARYALMPFFVFAEVIERNEPALKVYERRDGALGKAVFATIQQSYANGEFLPFNDALKEKTIASPDMVLALDLAFARCGRDEQLLDVAQRQGSVALSAAGFEVARALHENPKPTPFRYASVELRDGPDGAQGGLGILRSGAAPDQMLALLKYTAFGMEHGHFDKLQFMLYDQGRELIPDYGAARFLNIEQKYGGRYLPENKAFARQTIAHNTVTVDGRSHYGGEYEAGAHQHAERHFFTASDPDFQVMSARDTTAVPGVAMQRTIALVRDARFTRPLVLDVLRLQSTGRHRYDLPYYYQGTFLATNTALERHVVTQPVLGERDGYQHLWVEAEGRANGPVAFTWINGRRYYTITTAADEATRVLFVRSGANDPNFNLRHEPALLLRRDDAASHVFASVIEPHGIWDGTREFTRGGFPTVKDVRVLAATDDGTVVRITGEGGLAWTLLVSNRRDPAGAHRVVAGTETFTWNGPAALRR